MAQLRLTSGKEVSAKQFRLLIFKQQLLAMVDAMAWEVQSMAASVKGFARNILFYRILLAIFWSAVFLGPWLLLAFSYTLKVFADLIGKARQCVKSKKAIP
jgi:hypothetical protein